MINTGSRTTNAIRNILSGIIVRIIEQSVAFIVRTVLIHKMGSDYVGLDSLFVSILQVLSMAELGFSSAIIFKLYKPIAENDIKEICSWLSIYRIVYLVIGTVILCFGLVILPFVRLLIKGEYPHDINIYFLFAVYLVNVVVSYYSFAYKSSILIANQRRDLLNFIEMIVSIIRGFLQVTLLFIFQNYYYYILLLPISTLGSNILVNIVCNRYFPSQKAQGKFDLEKFRLIEKPLKGLAIGKISLVARNSFDSIILSMLFGLTSVTVYSNYYSIFGVAGAMLSIILLALSAGVGNSIATESIEKNYKDQQRFDFYYMWMVGCFTTCLFCLYQQFMKLWVGEQLMAPLSTMALFCIYFYVDKLSGVRALYTEAVGLWWKTKHITVMEMLANLVLNFFLGRIWGMNGILIATIVTAFMSSFIGITKVTFREYFKTGSGEYYCDNSIYLIVTFFVMLITYTVCRIVEVRIAGNILSFLICLVTCVIVTNTLFILIYGCFSKYRNYMSDIKKYISLT